VTAAADRGDEEVGDEPAAETPEGEQCGPGRKGGRGGGDGFVPFVMSIFCCL